MQLSTNLRVRRQFVHANPRTRALAKSYSRQCPVPDCGRTFTNSSGLTQHKRMQHPGYVDESSSDVDMAPPTEASSSGSEGANEDVEDENDVRGANTSHRATVEDVEDEGDLRSSGSEESRRETRRHYHSELNGMYSSILANPSDISP